MKIIYDSVNTKVTKELLNKVKSAHEKRKKTEPGLRMIDIWHELERKVKSESK